MEERLRDQSFWKELRKKTRVKGDGKGQCEDWCRDALQDEAVASCFMIQKAEMGTIQIDQYATSILVHYWLEAGGFIADGTAGQFDPEYEDGFYGLFREASDLLKHVYIFKERDDESAKSE